MILRGIDTAQPSLGVASDLTSSAAALYPQTLTQCLPQLQAPSSFGGLAPSDIVRSDVNLAPIVAALSAKDDPEDLKIRTPVRIQQGTADTTVFQAFTDPLVDSYRKKGTKVVYKVYEGVNHGGVVTAAAPARDATKYIRSRLG
jgi:hypothetical protein